MSFFWFPSVDVVEVETDIASLFPTADQGVTGIVNESNASSPLFSSIDDDPASPTDSDWINPHGTFVGEAWFDVTNTPGDFGSAVSIEMVLRWQAIGDFTTFPATRRLFARIYESDESTPLTDEEEVTTASSGSSWANTSPVAFSGVTAADKTTWDGARLRLRWE